MVTAQAQHRRDPSLLSSLIFIITTFFFLVRPTKGAWQEISDYTDCGSTNFKTEKILVDFNSTTYWLNVSVQGQFSRRVIDLSLQTEKLSTSLLILPLSFRPILIFVSHAYHRCILPSKFDLSQYFGILSVLAKFKLILK